MYKKVTATEFARGLSEFLNRIRYGRESFIVRRGGLDVCEVRPVPYASTFTITDLMGLLETLPHPGDEYLDLVDDGIRSQPRARDTSWDD